jgi:hypothetical protein
MWKGIDMKLKEILSGSPPTGVYVKPDGTEFRVSMVMGPSGWQPNRAEWLQKISGE